MKREALNHTKMRLLGRELGSIVLARGIMESLWHLTARETPQGDIGRKSDDEIAVGLDYDGDIEKLIAALVKVRFLDRSNEHRLIVHGWFEHAEDMVHMALARAGKSFATGEIPKMSRLSQAERAKAECAYAVRTPHAQDTHAVRTPYAPPCPALPCHSGDTKEPVRGAQEPPEPEPISSLRLTGQGRAGKASPPPIPQAALHSPAALLEHLRIGDPAFSTLIACPDLTIEAIQQEWAKCGTADKPNGALVGRLSKRFKVAVPKTDHGLASGLMAIRRKRGMRGA